MKSCGVVVEYNPLHNGHVYHLKKARELSGADIIIAVMSGNFLQRGEPAIIDKWSRAQMALAAGADIVIELPVAFSTQPADYFAKGAVGLLHAMKCDAICFGSETGESKDYQKLAQFLRQHMSEIDRRFKENKDPGQTYAWQMDQVLKEFMPDQPVSLSMPNNILGLAYAKENLLYEKPMELYTITRLGSDYHDKELIKENFSSATAIREKLLDPEQKKDLVEELKFSMPYRSFQLVTADPLVSWKNYWPYLKYQIQVQSLEELRSVYQVTEGIEYRLKAYIQEAESFEQFISLVKNKRVSWTRLQRICVYILLQLKKEEMIDELKKPKAIHLLGFNPIGRSYLKVMKKTFSLPLITNVTKKNNNLWTLDIKAGKIYQMGRMDLIKEQDYYRQPLKFYFENDHENKA